MLDASKMTVNGQVKVQPFHDVPIASGIGYLGDGIRVDYPNEIVLYVQRKNDITTNYYNFIGLSGNVPDGISIDIVDPYSVFNTEGAPDPRPAQTESGLLLAGGKKRSLPLSRIARQCAGQGTHGWRIRLQHLEPAARCSS